MFTRSMMMLLPVVALLTTGAGQPGDPSREDLQRRLMTSQDLAEATKISWVADAIVVRPDPGPAGTSEDSGCPDLDNAVLAENTGLTESGARPFIATTGDMIEETVVYDTLAQEHVRELAAAVAKCPEMRFTDGPAVVIKAVAMGETVAGFRGIIGGQSRSAVLVASHGDYVVELIASDDNYPDAYYLALLQMALHRIDNPS